MVTVKGRRKEGEREQVELTLACRKKGGRRKQERTGRGSNVACFLWLGEKVTCSPAHSPANRRSNCRSHTGSNASRQT
eukprot:554777-Rhodomonas_salina.4